jgi:hypothetical protein
MCLGMGTPTRIFNFDKKLYLCSHTNWQIVTAKTFSITKEDCKDFLLIKGSIGQLH